MVRENLAQSQSGACLRAAESGRATPDGEAGATAAGARGELSNLHLNTRCASDAYFLSPDVWKLNGGEPDSSAFEDNPVFGGLDLSSRQDLTALVLVARDSSGLVHMQPHFWAPAQGLRERAQRDRALTTCGVTAAC